MQKHHVIISGTGRSGTTFLVQLLTELGLDTGFGDPNSGVFENCRAGMERDLRATDAPYIVKDPALCDYLDDVLKQGQIKIDMAIVPVRDLFSAAESRRSVSRNSDPSLFPEGAPGGLWCTDAPEKQEAVLTAKLYQLIFTLAKWEIPVNLLEFPRCVEDGEYLFGRLRYILGAMEKKKFLSAFQKIAQPKLVSRFIDGQEATKPIGEVSQQPVHTPLK